MQKREVIRTFKAQRTSDGAGVQLARSIGTAELDHVDPFLLLDEFKSEEGADYVGGFPDHPHRGFETVTYMLAGSMQHKDHVGHEGTLVPGSVQWMTAGRGIIHSEMPRQEDGLLWGFQLWVNLPAADKMTPPRYQEFAPDEIPEVALAEGVSAKLISGAVGGQVGPVRGIASAPVYLDVALEAAASVELELPATHQAFVYTFDGGLTIEGEARSTEVAMNELALLGAGGVVCLAAGDAPARALVLAGQPLGEPIARHGPFVMNTREEIVQAVHDFQSGKF